MIKPNQNYRLIFVVSSPGGDVQFSFDVNATPNSIELSSLFDTFAQDTQAEGDFSNVDNALMENAMNDSLFGFMNDNYHSEALAWN
jgi:hypothetical protein